MIFFRAELGMKC